MNDESESDWSDLAFGIVGVVWIVAVLAILWTFAKGFWEGVTERESDAKP